MEDDALTRVVLAACLTEAGLNVIEACDADEAMKMLDADDESFIDIVFSDIQMPGQSNGFALARWARSHHPGVPVILTSGFDGKYPSRDVDSFGPVMSKPYKLTEVLRNIHDKLQVTFDACH